MRKTSVLVVTGFFVVGLGGLAIAHEGGGPHDESQEQVAADEQTLTGEVIDVMCYLSHGEHGQGGAHADCGKKCIKSGLPVALKVGDQLYLATMSDHQAANGALADYAGKTVTVHGQVLDRDGQRLIAISKIEKSN